MKRYTRLICLLSALMLLTGCAAKQPSSTEGTALPLGQTIPSTENPTEPPIETEPSTEATIPSTEPEPVYEQGPAVYINGQLIDDTLLDAGTVYVAAIPFCEILGGSGATVTFENVTYSFSAEWSHMLIGGTAVIPENPVICYRDAAYVPLKELCAPFKLAVLDDPEVNAVYCSASAWPGEVPEGYDVPVFMYHAVDNDLWGIAELFVRPEMMEAQLKYLSENGYDTIFFEDLYHVQDYDKPVILTFDDGYLDNYTQLFPLLKKYSCKATVFVIDKYIGNDIHYLNQEQIREMADSGLVSIQSHTVNHPDLDSISLEQQREELVQSKLLTARLSLRVPYVLCYPTGKYNNDTLSIIADSYSFGIKMRGGLYNTSDDRFLINRYYVARSDPLYWFTSTLEDIF